MPVEFAAQVDLNRDSGFLPLKLSGRKTGFEFYREPYSNVAKDYPQVAARKLRGVVVYHFVYGDSADECIAVFETAKVLVTNFGGLAFDPQGNQFLSMHQLEADSTYCGLLRSALP